MECVIKRHLYIYLLYMLITCEAYQQCKVPNADAGTCIRITQCKPLNDLYKKKPKTATEHLYIQQSLCGIGDNPIIKVCCPSPTVWSKFKPNPVIFDDSPRFNPKTVDSAPSGPNSVPVDYKLPQNDEPAAIPIRKPPIFAPVPKLKPSILPLAPNPLDLSNSNNGNAVKSRQRESDGTDIGTCGVDVSSATKISGGNVTAIDEYPWLALLEYAGEFLGCGGSLVSSRFVLTAAHCLVSINRAPKIVRLGEYDLSTYPTDTVEVNGGGVDEVNVTRVPIDKIFVHPKYNRIEWKNDIGMVRMSYSVTFDDFIKTICLPKVDYIKEFTKNTSLVLAGWGTDNTATIQIKVDVKIPFMPYDECKEVEEKNIQDTQICAGGEDGKDSCRGDSGGPLMYEKDKLFYVVGVVSYGRKRCGTAGLPAIYTHVYKYLTWINDVKDGIITS